MLSCVAGADNCLYKRESIRCVLMCVWIVTNDRFACMRRDSKLHMRTTTPKLDEHKLLKQVRQDRKEMGEGGNKSDGPSWMAKMTVWLLVKASIGFVLTGGCSRQYC